MATSKKETKPSVKTYLFHYEGTNAQGGKVSGDINSTNTAMAKVDLRRQGINATKVIKKNSLFYSQKRKGTVSSADISYIARQLSTMMIAGVPLVQSFDIVAKGVDKPAVQELVLAVKNDVESGRSLSESLRKHPLVFDDLFCNLVAAGESSGSLDTMLDRIATYKEKTESIKRKIKKALYYPTAIVLVAIIVSVILLVYVVPQFQKLFSNFHADLPIFTQMVIGLSIIVQKWWYIILFGSIAAGYVFVFNYKRSLKMRELMDKWSLKLPIVGSILHQACIARFARTLSTTFAAGVPLVEALDSVAGATGNAVYSHAVIKIKEEVSTGSQIQAAMRNTTLFPNMVVQMIAIGEESGSLDKMLSKVADIYEEQVDAAVDALSSLLEPLIMAILGVLVGGLVIAMYLPIFKMGSVI